MRYSSVYTAGPFAWQAKLRSYASELQAGGLVVNARWLTESTSALVKNAELPESYARKTAVLDVEDILASDALLLFTIGESQFSSFSVDSLARGGRHFETGLAYALGKKVIVCGEFKENVFHNLKDVSYYSTWEEARHYLLSKASRRRKPLLSRTFGRRKIVSSFGPNSSVCECSCGRIGVVEHTSLQRGEADSCGCAAMNSNAAKERVLSIYQYAARKRGLVWELSDEQFYDIVGKACYFCSASPSNKHVVRRKEWEKSFIYGGIDRLNNALGYVVDNVVPCCKTCNLAKGTTPAEDFLLWVSRVFHNRGAPNV